MPSIPCHEGETVSVTVNDGVDFGGVTSCMTITCLLGDGSKVAGHDAVFLRVQPQIFAALKARIGERGVKKVIAAGSGSSWTPRMTSQLQLSEDFAKNDRNWGGRNWSDQLDQMEPFLISGNPQRFRQMLAWQFSVPIDSVSFTNYDEGNIEVQADGTLVTG